MNWRALILLIIALAAMAAATAAQMNEQWQVIEIKSEGNPQNEIHNFVVGCLFVIMVLYNSGRPL